MAVTMGMVLMCMPTTGGLAVTLLSGNILWFIDDFRTIRAFFIS